MVALGILRERPVQVLECGVRIARVQCDCCGVNRLGGRLRSGGSPRRFPLAHLQIQPGSLDQLALVRISLNDVPEVGGRAAKIMTLQPSDAGLVQSQGLVERWPPRRWSRLD